MLKIAFFIWFIFAMFLIFNLIYRAIKGNPVGFLEFKWFLYGTIIGSLPFIFN